MKALNDQWPQLCVEFFGYQLAGVRDPVGVLGALCELIPRMIRCDEVVWYGADTQSRSAVMYATDTDRYGAEVRSRLLEATDDPQRRHYLSGADPSAAPVRIGDIAPDREFRNTRAWVDLYRPLGITRQLTIPTAFNPTMTGATAWSLNRSGSDFSDDDVLVAVALQPVLKAVQASATWRPDLDDALGIGSSGPRAPWPETSSIRTSTTAPLRQRLTPRELEVLSLVAEGFTARSIGFRLHISVGTVRKHLEHIYEKTGQRDRLLVVAYAHRAGLLPAS